jgi:putative SOS response-associated peptidase YedK
VFTKRRAIVPIPTFYEWRRREGAPKQPVAIARADGSPLALAGLWESCRCAGGEMTWKFCILTTTSTRDMDIVHDRMPVVFSWLLQPGEAQRQRDCANLGAVVIQQNEHQFTANLGF